MSSDIKGAQRHTFGTSLARRGVAPRAIQQMMDHASVQMTEVYIRGAQEQDHTVVDKLMEPARIPPRAA